MLRSFSDTTVCYCGKSHSHERLGWTVIRNTVFGGSSVFKVYKRDVPADSTHYAADLAPFTHSSKAKAVAAGKAGNFAYKQAVVS